MTIAELLAWGVEAIKPIAPESAAREASILLAHALGAPTYQLTIQRDWAAEAEDEARFRDLIARRQERCPVQYLTGRCEFYGLRFQVGPGVLIPRPETEHLVERALNYVGESPRYPWRVLEIGTGSGCISVALAAEMSGLVKDYGLLATDLTWDVLRQAQRNAQEHRVEDKIGFVACHGVPVHMGTGLFDVLVSNPPYISEADYAALQPEVRDWEPQEALVGGPSGLEVTLEILREAPRVMKPRGLVLLEIGAGQSEQYRKLDLARWGYSLMGFHKDLAGIERVLRARLA